MARLHSALLAVALICFGCAVPEGMEGFGEDCDSCDVGSFYCQHDTFHGVWKLKNSRGRVLEEWWSRSACYRAKKQLSYSGAYCKHDTYWGIWRVMSRDGVQIDTTETSSECLDAIGWRARAAHQNSR